MRFGCKLAFMRTIRTALLVSIAGCLLAQNAADDPGGWTKAKWGMAQDEVKATFSGLNLYAYAISGRKFSVAILFDGREPF